MFNPFAQVDRSAEAAASSARPAPESSKSEDIDELKTQLNAMQAQLAKLVKDRE